MFPPCGPGGNQLPVLQPQSHAVRRQAGLQPAGQTGRQVPSVGRRAHQQNLGLLLLHQTLQHLAVALCPVILQRLLVAHIHSVRAVGKRILRLLCHAAAQQHRAHAAPQLVRQTPRLAQHLKGDSCNLSACLLQAYPYCFTHLFFLLYTSLSSTIFCTASLPVSSGSPFTTSPLSRGAGVYSF